MNIKNPPVKTKSLRKFRNTAVNSTMENSKKN